MSKPILSPLKKVMINKNQVVIGNTESGSWMKLPKECYQILQEAEKNGILSEDLLSRIHKDDRGYFGKILANLEELGILIDEEKQKKIIDDFKLSSATIMLTKRCNLYCKHCIVSAGTLKDKEFFSTEQILSIIDKLGKCGLKNITLTGGEPLVRKDFKEIVSYIKEKWDMRIDLMTNGTLITEELAAFLAKNIYSINISVDGANEESCSVIRGKGTFGKVIKAINNLHAVGFENITLSIVETQANLMCMDKFLELCSELKVKPLRRIFEESGRAEQYKEILSKLPDRECKNCSPNLSYEELRRMTRGRTCRAGYNTLSIDDRGNISPCQVFLNPELVMGNIMEIDDLKQFIIQRYRHSVPFTALKKYYPENVEHCQSCNVSWFCWICPHEMELMMTGKKSLCEYCKARKPYLEKLVWGS